MAKIKTKITYQTGKGFKKCVGKFNGKPRIFWLGKDEGKAEKLATSISDEWRKLQALDKSEWTNEALEQIEQVKQSATANNEASETIAVGKDTLGEAFQAYRVYVASDAKKGQANKAKIYASLKVIESLEVMIGGKNIAVAEIKLDKLGFDEIQAIVNALVARPHSLKGEAYAVVTCKNFIIDFRMMIDWLDTTNKFTWELPRRWEKAFKNAKPKRTNAERMEAAKGVKTFTVTELAKLYTNASERTRLFILLALNCSFAQSEIASLMIGECHLSGNRPYIERIRAKTDEGDNALVVRWYLWEETASALKTYMASVSKRKANWKSGYEGSGKDSNELVFRSEDGNPLRYYVGNVKFDSVRMAWDRLMDNEGVADVQKLSFKYLRKTSSQIMRSIGGQEYAEIMLAHTDKTTGRFYNNADFEKLDAHLATMREQLEPIFAAVESVETRQAA